MEPRLKFSDHSQTSVATTTPVITQTTGPVASQGISQTPYTVVVFAFLFFAACTTCGALVFLCRRRRGKRSTKREVLAKDPDDEEISHKFVWKQPPTPAEAAPLLPQLPPLMAGAPGQIPLRSAPVAYASPSFAQGPRSVQQPVAQASSAPSSAERVIVMPTIVEKKVAPAQYLPERWEMASGSGRSDAAQSFHYAQSMSASSGQMLNSQAASRYAPVQQVPGHAASVAYGLQPAQSMSMSGRHF